MELDFLGGGVILDLTFEFEESEPLKPHFGLFGIEGTNFLQNTGSVMIIVFGIVSLFLVFFMFMMLCYPYQVCRRVMILLEFLIEVK